MSDKLITILIPAVGGQGGAVLTEWLINALEIEDFEVQGISLPGLSQRGGSTTFYIEAFLKKSNENIVFSLYPLPGHVDLILSQELLELGRILKEGFGSKDTTIVSSTHRIYSTQEKLPIASGIYSDEVLTKFAEEFSNNFIGVDLLKVAEDNGMNQLATNAILLGALSASFVLPVKKESYQKAIETVGVSSSSNLKAFTIGYDYVIKNKKDSQVQETDQSQDSEFNKYIKVKDADRIEKLKSGLSGKYPDFLIPLITEALYRLTDYQSAKYAESYLKKLEKFREIDQSAPNNDFRLTEYVLKNLALLMSYEDGIRVSELKIRDERFKRIKKEMQIRDDQIFKVVDYLKPDAEEVYGLFPNIIVSPVLYLLDKLIWKNKEPLTVAQKPTTTSIFGFFRIWMLAKLKFMRPYSYRYKNEHKIIELYLASVEKFAEADYELGVLAAKSGSIIKGYGRVRRRTIDTFRRLYNNVVTKIYDYELERGTGFDKTKEIFIESVELISGDEASIEKAEELAEDFLK